MEYLIKSAALLAACQTEKKLLLYIVSIVFLLPRARGARPPQGPGDPPWKPVKNSVFSRVLEIFGRKPSNYPRAGPRRQLAPPNSPHP